MNSNSWLGNREQTTATNSLNLKPLTCEDLLRFTKDLPSAPTVDKEKCKNCSCPLNEVTARPIYSSASQFSAPIAYLCTLCWEELKKFAVEKPGNSGV